MRFVDEVEIEVSSGKGGDGCIAFRREKYVPKGGPSGGDGGRGGDVVLVADSSRHTLLDLRYQRRYRAKNGQPGRGKDQNGKAGANVLIPVPVGTVVKDSESGEVLVDLVRHGQEFIVAKGGKGGRGNRHFATPTLRAPRIAEPGEPGVSKRLKLELKLLADVGVIGLPNAGKSTLISKISKARPKVADYPFTTLVPNLGVVMLENHDTFVVADVPGLVQGSHKGAGLGHRFLRHIERCKVLVHLVETPHDHRDPIAEMETIENELQLYKEDILHRPRIIGISKIDLGGDPVKLGELKNAAAKRNMQVVEFSSVTGSGIRKLVSSIAELLNL